MLTPVGPKSEEDQWRERQSTGRSLGREPICPGARAGREMPGRMRRRLESIGPRLASAPHGPE
jgi:hypothetical protein